MYQIVVIDYDQEWWGFNETVFYELNADLDEVKNNMLKKFINEFSGQILQSSALFSSMLLNNSKISDDFYISEVNGDWWDVKHNGKLMYKNETTGYSEEFTCNNDNGHPRSVMACRLNDIIDLHTYDVDGRHRCIRYLINTVK